MPSPQRLGYAGTVLQRLVEHGRTVLGVHQAWIAVDPHGDGPGFTAAAAGTDPDLIGARLSADNRTPDLAASVPVIVGGRSHGRLCVASPVHAGELQPQDFDLLGELASLTGEALNHHQRRDPAAGDSQAEINALVRAMAAVDGDTYRHSLEVAATALAVAERLGLEGVDLVEVELGALLHDVGKLHLPPRILKKAGPLDPEELRLVRMHPEWGANMVARIPGLEAVALVVRLHHERPGRPRLPARPSARPDPDGRPDRVRVRRLRGDDPPARLQRATRRGRRPGGARDEHRHPVRRAGGRGARVVRARARARRGLTAFTHGRDSG